MKPAAAAGATGRGASLNGLRLLVSRLVLGTRGADQVDGSPRGTDVGRGSLCPRAQGGGLPGQSHPLGGLT